MSHRERVRDFWDGVVNDFLDGDSLLPPPLDCWFLAYEGAGDGAVDVEAFPEPFVGDLTGDVRGVVLGLNPGLAHPRYQYRDGILAEEIRAAGSYSEVFKTPPMIREPWVSDLGAVGYFLSRTNFMRRWLDNQSLDERHLLIFELYPWHSKRVTAPMRPEPSIIDEMVFDPIGQTGVRHVFAFGAPWFRLLDTLGLSRLVTLGVGGEPYGSLVASRSVAVYERNGYFIVAERHQGSAGPPNAHETVLLKNALVERGLA